MKKKYPEKKIPEASASHCEKSVGAAEDVTQKKIHPPKIYPANSASHCERVGAAEDGDTCRLLSSVNST